MLSASNTAKFNPASHALKAVGQAIVSSLNPATSTVAQLNAVRAWVAANQESAHPVTLQDAIARDGTLSGNPVAIVLAGNYGLTTGDINAFFARYNIQSIVDQDGTNNTLNTGLQVIRAIDTQTSTQTIFVAGADFQTEFQPIGVKETNGGFKSQAQHPGQ
jgi:hypothetical protein